MDEQRPRVPDDMQAATARVGRPHGATWFHVVGGVLILIGLLAIAFPLVSTLATTVLIAWLLVLSGAAQIVHAFIVRTWRGAVWSGIIGLVWLAAGLFALLYPLASTVGFTLAVAAVFITQGVLALIGMSREHRGSSRTWQIVSGVIAIAAGLLIGLGLPISALWVLGILAGVNFIAAGVAHLAVGSMKAG